MASRGPKVKATALSGDMLFGERLALSRLEQPQRAEILYRRPLEMPEDALRSRPLCKQLRAQRTDATQPRIDQVTLHSGMDARISAASFSGPHYQNLSTMAGFHQAPGTGPEESTLAPREPTFDWDLVDALHSPGDLKGLVPELRYVLSDEDDRILDVVHTGSPAALEAQSGPHESAWALDSL
jgi:hypothetical protein